MVGMLQSQLASWLISPGISKFQYSLLLIRLPSGRSVYEFDCGWTLCKLHIVAHFF